jgi:YHS domain-containing protein
MKTTSATSRDPVCGMDVTVADPHPTSTYRGLTFHFCSSQCLERFQQTPEFYTGPQRTADIHPIPKHRHLKVLAPTSEALDKAISQIQTMMGILSAEAVADGLKLSYDLRQASLAQIEAVLQREGIALKGGFHGFRRSLWKFNERNEIENAARAGTGACCNHPPTRTH